MLRFLLLSLMSTASGVVDNSELSALMSFVSSLSACVPACAWAWCALPAVTPSSGRRARAPECNTATTCRFSATDCPVGGWVTCAGVGSVASPQTITEM